MDSVPYKPEREYYLWELENDRKQVTKEDNHYP